jgi:hypothetical protein
MEVNVVSVELNEVIQGCHKNLRVQFLDFFRSMFRRRARASWKLFIEKYFPKCRLFQETSGNEPRKPDKNWKYPEKVGILENIFR